MQAGGERAGLAVDEAFTTFPTLPTDPEWAAEDGFAFRGRVDIGLGTGLNRLSRLPRGPAAPGRDDTTGRIGIMRSLPLAAVSAVAAFLAAATALAEDAVVNVYNWSDYIDEEILAEFEAETGIKVVYDVFDSNNILETKLLTGSTGYDVVVPSGTFLARQIQAGVFQKLDKSRLPNIGNMDEAIMARVRQWDPENSHAVNYMWGTTGFGLNTQKIAARDANAPTGSWRLLFDPEVVSKFADCGVYLMDEPDEVIPAALNFIGEDPDSHDTDVIAKAEPVLMAIRPHIRRFHNAAQINDLANGDICLAMGWSGDMLQARDRAYEAENDVEIEYVIPDEGALMWFDMMAIPADAPHPGNAHRFIDYIMRPEVIAKASNYVFYANGNAAATAHLDPELIEDPGIYPPDTARARLYVTSPYPAEVQRFVTRLWTRVKGA